MDLRLRFMTLLSMGIATALLYSPARASSSAACEFYFDSSARSSLATAAPGDKFVNQINDQLTASLRKRSEALERFYRDSQGNAPVDTVFIGGGLHGSIFSSSAAQKNANPSLIVLEAGDVISSVFGNMKGTFRINSPELKDASSNRYPHAPVVMKDLTKDEFPNSLHMAMLATATQYASDVPVLFNQRVTTVTDLWLTKKAQTGPRYRIETATGLVLHANRVVFGTGLGDPSVPIKDPASREFAERELKKADPRSETLSPVSTVDTLLSNVSNRTRGNKNFRAESKGKTFIIMGSGDGGKIAIESILSDIFSPDTKVVWVSQKAMTPEEYKTSTWERYYGLAPEFGKRIEPVPDHGSSIERLTDGRFRVHCENTGITVEGDYLVLATGYRKNYSEPLKGLAGTHTVTPDMLKPSQLEGQIDASSEPTALGVRIDVADLVPQQLSLQELPPQALYVVGPAAGPLASKAELERSITQNPVAIELLGPRTAKMAELLVRDGGVASDPLKEDSRLRLTTKLVSSRENPSQGRTSPSARAMSELRLKIELARGLRHQMFATEAVTFTIKPSSASGDSELTVSGLDLPSANRLLDSIEADRALVAALLAAARHGETKILVPVKHGHAVTEDMDIRIVQED